MAFDYYSPVTINAGQVPSAQTDFPILISVTDARFKSVANGGHVKNANGYDIRPYSDATLLTAITGYELERYNGSTGEVIMNVKRSSVIDGLITYLGYGDSSLVADGSSATTWSNGFLGVYHLGDGTTLNVNSATGSNNGTNHGATATAGQIDGAGAFASVSSQYVGLGGGLAGNNIATYSAWVKATSFPGAFNAVMGYDGNGHFALLMVNNSGKLSLFTNTGNINGTGSHALSAGTWYFVVMTVAISGAGSLKGYVNASLDGSTIGTIVTDATAPFNIGRDDVNGRYWNGVIDEARVSNVVRSQDWITTEYNEGFPATFETLGNEVSLIPPTPTPEPIIVIPEERNVGGARGWKKRLLDEKLWMDKQDEMFLKIANEDDLEVVHVLTDFLSRV